MINIHNRKGFTIVELLIVIAVIAILAAITIVSYGTVTQKANNASAASAAEQVQRKGEVYKSESTSLGVTGYYPVTLATMLSPTATSDKSYQVVGVTYDALASAPSSPNKVRYDLCGVKDIATAATSYGTVGTGIGNGSFGQWVTGAKIYTWDYQGASGAGAITTNPQTIGQTSGNYPGTAVAIACFAAGS